MKLIFIANLLLNISTIFSDQLRNLGGTAIKLSATYSNDYLVTFNLGTPAQKVQVIMDSGSCWIVIVSCVTTPCDNLTYDASKSTSSKQTTETVNLSYGTNSKTSGSGTVASDLFDMNGKFTGNFVMMPSSSSDVQKFTSGPATPFGLCFNYDVYNNGKTSKAMSYVNYLYSQGLIPLNEFSIKTDLSTNQAEFTIGGRDSSLAYSLIPVDTTSFYWRIKVNSVNGVAISSQNTMFVVDTGAGHLDLPVALNTSDFLNSIKAGNACTANSSMIVTCTCTAITDLSNLVIIIDPNRKYTLPPNAYATFKSGVCTTIIQFTQTTILGNSFIRNFNTVFDYTGKQIGFNASFAGVKIEDPSIVVKSQTIPISSTSFSMNLGLSSVLLFLMLSILI